MKPIETEYAGVLFRSRLEAKWALFFDELGISWDYEPESFRLSSGEGYLPDFWLPRFDRGLYVEVKPDGDPFLKARRFALERGGRILLAEGPPRVTAMTICEPPPPDVEPKANDARGEVRVCWSDRYLRKDREHRFYTMPDDDADFDGMAPSVVEAIARMRRHRFWEPAR